MGLFDIFDSEDDERAAREAAAARVAGFNTGRDDAYSQLDTGLNAASGYYDKALVPFTDLLQRGTKGYDTYLDATGVNGAEGLARAGELYKSIPGYSAGLDTGLDLLERRAAARGDLGGGNTSADTIKYASDYDASRYKDFLTSLTPNIGVATGAATGSSNVLQNQGNLYSNVGSQKANYGYQAATGAGQAEAGGIEAAQKAREQASGNFWNALMGGANLALKAFNPFGGGGGGGGGSSSTFSYGGQTWPMFS